MLPPTRPLPADLRVLILAATPRDSDLTEEILGRNGVESVCCASLEELCARAREGAGMAIFAEEVLAEKDRRELLALLEDQPSWSDLPVLVMARPETSLARLSGSLGGPCNLTILERPVQIVTLLSAVQVALRARQRQYEVRDLLARLRESDRRKDDFLAMLGHELRNPLGVIRTALALLELEGLEAPTASRRLESIGRQLGHLTRMVEDLLDLSRISRGKISLRLSDVELVGIVRQTVEAMRGSAEGEAHRLRLSLPERELWVRGDEVRLEQVISNLLNNAFKYTPAGGKVEVALELAGEEAVLRVADEGVGIEPAQIPVIFESFAQIDSSLARSSGGLGLGLSLVRHIVGLHSGSVEAESDGPGKGSTFAVRLPLIAAAERVAPASEQVPSLPEVTSGRPLRVVVVEDMSEAREALGELLRLSGHQVELVADGSTAVEKILASQPHLALVDIGLPGIDGYEVARRVCAAEHDGVVLVAMTGYGLEQDRERALEAGFDEHLVKPVEPGRLFQLLAEVAGPMKRGLQADRASRASSECRGDPSPRPLS